MTHFKSLLIKTTALVTASFVMGCSVLPDKDKTPQAAEKVGEPRAKPQASIEAKQLAAEQEATAVTEIDFAKGAKALSADAQRRLKSAMARVGDGEKVAKVMVVAWADQEYPSVHAKDLPKAARNLAEARAKAVTDFISKPDRKHKLDIEVHNMAERPGAFENWLSSSDARVKKSLEVAGVPNTDTSIKSPSKASKAIVLVVEK